MWCYQKPGFKALLITELQRQQQCSRFCDTMLKTEGIFKHLNLTFSLALLIGGLHRNHWLLNLPRIIIFPHLEKLDLIINLSGMFITSGFAGQGCYNHYYHLSFLPDISVPAHSCILSAISPHISSALSSTPSPPPGQSRLLEFQSLGACTLLRVVRLMYSGEMVGEGEKEKQEAISAAAKLGIHGLVEVTTGNGENSPWVEVGVQTEPLSEKEWREGKWVREVRDGSTILWKERLPGGVKDTWTQTEQLQVNTTAPESSFETIDLACLQNLRHADSTVILPQIPLIPISLLYPPNENQNPQPFFAPMNSLQEPPTAGPSSAVMDLPPSLASLFSQETASSVTTQSSWTASQVAARNKLDHSSFEQFQGNILGYTGNFVNQRKQSRRGRPRGRRRESGARGAQTAGRGERRPRRPSAGTVGRGRGGFTVTLDVQDVGLSAVQKAFLQRWSTRSSRAGQGGGAVGRKLYLKTREVPMFTKSRRKGREKVIKSSPNKVLPLPEGRRVLAGGCNPRTAPVSTPSLHPSPSPGLRSSTGSYVSPALSILHNTPAPLPPRDEQVEHIDRLLEEVMMGLDIFPNIGAQRVLPASSSSCTDATSTARENRQQGHAVAVVKEGGSSGAGNSKGPVPHQQGETDFREMLENFLSTFEQEIHGCAVTENSEIQTGSPMGSCQAAANQQAAETQTPARSQQLKPSAHHTTRPQCTNSRKKSVPNTPQKKRGRNKYKPSQLPTSVPSSELNVRKLQKQENQQLQQTPVVKLDRRVPLPDRVILRGNRLQNLNIKV